MCVCVCVCGDRVVQPPSGVRRLPKKLLVSAPYGGSRRAGGQKLRWNDLLSKDLKKCGLEKEWQSLALDRKSWRSTIKSATEELNRIEENEEKCRKDEKRKRREERQISTDSSLKCDQPGCVFVALSEVGLCNHICQSHTQLQFAQCSYCNKTIRRQGLYNHQRFCSSRPA